MTYTRDDLERLAMKFCDGNDASRDPWNPDAVKLRLFLGMFIIWLSNQSQGDVLQFDLREEGRGGVSRT